jgi:hypothetical protein
MRSRLTNSLALAAVVLAACAANFAQPARSVDKHWQKFIGETLKFDGKINKIIHGISIAELTFSVSDTPSGDVVIHGEAVSKGTLLKLFRYSFLQQYDSTIDGTKIRILKTAKHDVQKERVRDSEAVFDYGEKRVRFTETDPKDPNRPPRMIASEIGEPTHDIISAIWAIRAMPLSVGAHYDLNVSDSGLMYPVPVKVTGREVMKTVIGRVSCFKVEPEIFGKGRLIEKRGALIIWMTDDARHLPVRASIDSEYGKIEIRLKSATGGK